MEFVVEKRKKEATARRSIDPGTKPNRMMQMPPAMRAEKAVTIRFLKPPPDP